MIILPMAKLEIDHPQQDQVVASPIYTLAMRAFHRGRIFLPEYSVIAPSLLIVLALTIVTVVVVLRLGVKNLERIAD